MWYFLPLILSYIEPSLLTVIQCCICLSIRWCSCPFLRMIFSVTVHVTSNVLKIRQILRNFVADFCELPRSEPCIVRVMSRERLYQVHGTSIPCLLNVHALSMDRSRCMIYTAYTHNNKCLQIVCEVSGDASWMMALCCVRFCRLPLWQFRRKK